MSLGLAAIECPCGWTIGRDIDHGTWVVLDPDNLPANTAEEHLGAALARQPSDHIVCACGRTYYGIPHRPWIVEAGDDR